MNKVLIFTGLGANRSAFDNISFPPNWSVEFYDWSYNFKHLSLIEYVQNIRKEYLGDFDIVIGLSFGSIIAQEFSLLCDHPPKIIILSGIRSRDQLTLLRLLLPILKMIPSKLFEIPNPIIHWLFSTNNPKARKVLSQIISQSNGAFVKWCLINLASWREKELKSPIVSIHGEADRLLKAPQITDLFKVKGGHFAVYQNAEEINKVFSELKF